MANKFQIKRTTTTGRTPNTTNAANSTYIAAGELAINLTDDKLFSSDGTNLIEVGSNLTSLSVSGNTVVAQINATSVYVGANVNITTSGLYVGNSTVNAVLTADSLTINSVPISIIGIYDSSNTVLANAFFVSGASINQLSDVDTVTVAPANNDLLVWSNSVSNWVPKSFSNVSPITTTGDLIIGNGTNSSTRLPIGANGYILQSNGTTATWVVNSGGGGGITTGKSIAMALIFGF